MLAARPDALLRRSSPACSPLLVPEEDILELVHPRVGEHQRRVVARYERRRRHGLMAGLHEIIEKSGPDVVDATHHLPLPSRVPKPERVAVAKGYVAAGLNPVQKTKNPLPAIAGRGFLGATNSRVAQGVVLE